MLHALQQEEIFNVFTDDWKALGTEPEAENQTGQESLGLQVHKTFTDPKYTENKTISSVNWHPTIPGRVERPALKKTDLIMKHIESSENESFLWEQNNVYAIW